jgi:probable rRNA maturation factor
MITVDLQLKVDCREINLNDTEEAIKQYLIKKLPHQDVLVDLVITTPEEVLELNQKYRQKDSTTDVLSFPIFNNIQEIKDHGLQVNIGTIVINLDKSISQAKDNKRTPQEEVIFLCKHSIEHLLGHHHPE